MDDRQVRRLGATRATAVRARIVAATSRDLPAAVARGGFRADLYYRLGAAEVHVPPLRARAEDLAPLCRHLLAESGHPAQPIDPLAGRSLARFHWPGNVRELRNELVRASLMAGTGPIRLEHLSPRITGAAANRAARLAAAASSSGTPAPLRVQVAAFEAEVIADALQAANGSRTRAARLLGLPRRTLFDRMRQAGLVGVSRD
jgi:DNA-binding NtrC family response regulator